MKIQLLTYSGNEKNFACEHIAVHPFGQAEAFGMYDVNVISLQSRDIWRCDNSQPITFSTVSHISTFVQMACGSWNGRLLVLLPENYVFKYERYGRGEYCEFVPIKDIISNVIGMLSPLLPQGFGLRFGGSVTNIQGLVLHSDFAIDSRALVDVSNEIKSDSGDVTCISMSEGACYSTLIPKNSEELLALLGAVKLIEYGDHVDYPTWLTEVPYLDDEDLRARVETIDNEIERLKSERESCEVTLAEHESIKSVLCTKDDDLERTTRGMLARMLEVDENIEDCGEEDFSFEVDGYYLAFEIKGAIGGLKGSHVSKTLNHVQIRQEDFDEKGATKEVKGVLIISHFIEKPPAEKDPLNERQVSIAKKDGICVLTAETFLRCYEMWLNGMLSKNDFVTKVIQTNGELLFDQSKRGI